MFCKTAAEVRAGSTRFVMERKGYGKSGDGLEEGLEESGDASLPDSCFFVRFALENGVTGVTLGCRSGKLA